jgi:hypothetical protein
VGVNLFILDGFPHACSTKTLSRQRPAVHADGDPALLQQFGEGFAGELAALIGVEYFRFSLQETASSSASMEKEMYMAIDMCKASTRRLAKIQSALARLCVLLFQSRD